MLPKAAKEYAICIYIAIIKIQIHNLCMYNTIIHVGISNRCTLSKYAKLIQNKSKFSNNHLLYRETCIMPLKERFESLAVPCVVLLVPF